MKIVFYILKFILVVAAIAWFSVVSAQTITEIKVDLEVTGKPLKEILASLEQKSNLHFVYNEALVSGYNSISVSSKNRTVASILNEVIGKTNLRYIQQGNKIIIEKKELAQAGQNGVVGRTDVITGVVLNESTGMPVRNASIYFDGTLNGTTSDSTGNFTLDLRSTSKSKISVTAVGYAPGAVSDYTPGIKLTINLKQRAYELETVEISANEGMSRKEKMKLFRREFLGDDDNAWNCDILNEDDIRLSYNMKKNILRAYCDNPIVVHNKNLGYIVNFTMESFVYSDDGTFFTGTQFFKEDINPLGVDPVDAKKVEKARKATYLGSRMHFIRSLWNNELKKNNFRINRALGYQVYYENLVVEHDNQKFMRPTETLEIIYKWSKSNLYKNTLGKEIYIDKNGYNNPAGVNWAGAIGDERIGDSLPLEYGLSDADAGTVAATGGAAKNIAAEPAVSFTAPLDTLRSKMPVEKLYIHFDKPYYSSGDTLRMKAYLFDAGLLRGSVNSGLVYVELYNDSNQVVLRRMLPLGFGLGTGNIVLNESEVPEGGYTLRAYTNLMRNFSENVFEKHFFVSSTAKNMLVTSTSKVSRQGSRNSLQLSLRFSEFDRKAMGMREMDFRVQDNKKVLFKDKLSTDVNGNVEVNFIIPEKTAAKSVSIIAGNGKDVPALTIPVALNRLEYTDLQFMPEGGNLVTGISSRVAFKALSEDGNGAEVSGKIYNEKNIQVATFETAYKGMGSFELVPENLEYTAKLDLGDGTSKSFILPAVKNTGTVIRVTNSPKEEWITVTVSKSASINQQAKYYLVGQSRGMILYEEPVHFDGYAVSEEKIPKNLFPTGIVRFTLMSSEKQPINERLTFVDHHDNLNINIVPDKESYTNRDSIALNVQVMDDSGNPVQGTFSLSVTDDGQVKTDSLDNNILTSVLLTSGLKGNIEEPGHYFQKTDQSAADLDHLLLTQGWIGYDWKDVFAPPASLAFRPEFEMTVRGRVGNGTKKVDFTTVQLISSNPSFFKTDTVRTDGSFRFSGFPLKENMHFFLQAKDSRKRNTELTVEPFKAPVFKPLPRFMPWYVNSDSKLIQQAVTQSGQQIESITRGTNLLQEVTIAQKKIVKGSKNLNGPGQSDQVLDESDLSEMSKKTLLEVMTEKIKGFNVGMFPTTNPPMGGVANSYGLFEDGGKPGDLKPVQRGGSISVPFKKKQSYRVFDKEVHLVIDGTDVEQFYMPDTEAGEKDVYVNKGPGTTEVYQSDYVTLRNNASVTDRLEFIKSYLVNIKGDDVKGVEIMSDPRYNTKYKSLFSSSILGNLSVASTDFAYVEVTTYSGNGAFLRKMPGAVYNPVQVANTAAFYRPKYTSKNSPVPDLRSTIHWEPDILTDNEGKASISFYSADKPGSYSIIMEGSNMNGSVGRKTGTILIK